MKKKANQNRNKIYTQKTCNKLLYKYYYSIKIEATTILYYEIYYTIKIYIIY